MCCACQFERLVSHIDVQPLSKGYDSLFVTVVDVCSVVHAAREQVLENRRVRLQELSVHRQTYQCLFLLDLERMDRFVQVAVD